MRTGIFWMLAATCLFVCQDTSAHLKAYPVTGIAFARYFVHMILVSVFIVWRDPRFMISRRQLLPMLRSSFLLGAAPSRHNGSPALDPGEPSTIPIHFFRPKFNRKR